MRHLPLALLALLLLWAPLPFGSVTPMGVAIAVTLVAVLAAGVASRGQAPTVRGVRGVLVGLAGLGLLGMLQASRLVGRLLALAGVSPAAHVPEHLASVAPPTLSLAPALSRQAAVGWWALALLFVSAMALGRQRRAKPWLLAAAVVAAAFQALYGWRQWRAAPYEILGREVPGPPRLRGTFVNADHLAVLFEIVMAICIAWGWWAWRRSRREPRLLYRLTWLVPPVVCWLASAAALVGTGSRAALAAVVIGCIVQAALVFGPRRRWLVPVGLLVAVAAAATLLVSRGPSPGLGRQLSRPAYEVLHSSRFVVWGPAFSLWRGSPWIGTGLGTFEEGFPRVQPVELRRERWGRAHNDPLELLVTGGMVGVGLLGLALVSLIRRLWRVYRLGGRHSARAAALAALAALPAVVLHEGVDFGLTIPANALLLTVLVAVGAAGPTSEEEGAAPLRSPYRRPRQT